MTDLKTRTLSEQDWERMPWHARQRFLSTLRTERDRLLVEMLDRRSSAESIAAQAKRAIRDANAVLATLPPDPRAAQHAETLDRELARRAAVGPAG